MVNSFYPIYVNVQLLNGPFQHLDCEQSLIFLLRFAHSACGSDEGRYIFGIQNESETDIDAITNESFDQFSLTFVLPRFPNNNKIIIIK